MTMKPNTELNTMMFFDDALEGERTQLLTELADAVSETRTAADQAAELNEDGEAGLLRLTEIWCAMNGVPAIVIFEGSQSELLANVVAQIYAHLLQHPFHDPVGLAVCVELRYMTDALMLGVWFEYPHSAAYAKEHGELEQYRASNRANLQCKEAIEAAVREHFDGAHLSHDAAKGVIETYGMDRVMLVLANTVQLKDWDGRYSPRNKEWAKTIPNYNSDTVRVGYAVNSHPAVLNGFIDLVREEHLRRQPLTAEDIQAEAERILRELRAPDVPNSPHGTHYMARISPEFLNRAGSKDHDRLMNLLPFRSLTFTGMKGLPGTYATILASEDRTKELRQLRSSVREHLKQEPKQTAPKVPAHKKREPER